MNLESLQSHFGKFRNIYIAIGLIIFFFVLAGLLFESCGDYFFNRDIEKKKANVNAMMDNANAIKGDISNLKVEEGIRQAEVNLKQRELINASSATNNQQVVVNAQLQLINAIEKAKEVNVNLQLANQNRCLAFPDAEDCF